MSIRFLAVAALAAVGATACGGSDAGDKAAYEALNARVGKLEDKLRRVEKAAGLLEPDPAVTYSMPVEGYPADGPAGARVTLVEGFEYACPYCYKVRPTVAELKKRYGDKLRVVYKQLIIHQQVAVVPGLAACAAHRQGKYGQMSDLIWEEGFAKAHAGEEFDPSLLGPEKMKELAEKAGLDLARYEEDATGEWCMDWLRESHTSFADLEVNATPAFFVNGRFLSGALPVDELAQLIDEELDKADKAIAAGAKADSYYQDQVVAKGKTEVE